MSPAKAPLSGVAGAFAIAAIIFTWATCSVGCGKSALELSSDTLDLAHDMQEEGVHVITAQLREELARECGDLTERVDKLECGRAVGERYEARQTATGASAETIDGASFALWSWARAVAAKEADEGRPPVAVCEALSRVVALIDDWAAVRGNELPIEPWSCPGYEPDQAAPEIESSAENNGAAATAPPRSSNRRPACRDSLGLTGEVFSIAVVFKRIHNTLPELTGPCLSGDRASANGFVCDTADDGTKEEGDENLVIHASLLPLPAARAEVMS